MSKWYFRTIINGKEVRLYGGSDAKRQFISIVQRLRFMGRVYFFHMPRSEQKFKLDEMGLNPNAIIETYYPLSSMGLGDEVEFSLYKKTKLGKFHHATLKFTVNSISSGDQIQTKSFNLIAEEIESSNDYIIHATSIHADKSVISVFSKEKCADLMSNEALLSVVRSYHSLKRLWVSFYKDGREVMAPVIYVNLLQGINITIGNISNHFVTWDRWYDSQEESVASFSLNGKLYTFWGNDADNLSVEINNKIVN